ncbi:MAG: hypothetical protein ABI112_18710 [Terracoccus sp.]
MPRYVDVVLTGVQSLTHLVYASSYLRHRLDTDGSIDGIRLFVAPTQVLLAKFSEAEVRALLPSDERLTTIIVEPGTPWWRGLAADCVLLSIGAPGTRALARLLGARWGRKPLVVVVDEGIGSYGNWRSRRAAYVRKGGREPEVSLRAAAVAGANAVVPDVRWSLYRRMDGRWFVDPLVAAEFRLHLDNQQLERPSVVYLTQPWVKLGVMTVGEHARHLDHLRVECERQGFAFGVRPHPLDDLGLYRDVWVMTKQSAAEFDRRIAEACLVIGGSSTALLNIRALHGTRVMRIGTPGLAGLDRTLSARQRSLLDAVLPPPVAVDGIRSALALD